MEVNSKKLSMIETNIDVPLEPYGGPKVVAEYIENLIPEDCRDMDDPEFEFELFNRSFIKRFTQNDPSYNGYLKYERDDDKTSILRGDDYLAIFWKFIRPEDILQMKIVDVMGTPSKFYEWLSFLFTKYNVWEGKYSLDEVVEYYSNKDEVDPTTVEGILKMMDKNLCKRYFSIRECMEKNLDRISPRKILDRFDEDDLEEIFYENLGDSDDLIYGDNGTVLTFKK